MNGSTRTETYNLLDSWLRAWEKLLEKPRDILLERSFLNIGQAALVEIHGKYVKGEKIEQSARGWGSALLALLKEEFKDKSQIIDFLRQEYPAEIDSLEKLLKQGKFDTTQIYPLLKKIEGGPSIPLLFRELGGEILKDQQADFDRVLTASELVLRKALLKYPISTLKEKLQISLARHCSKAVIEKRCQEIAENEELNDRIRQKWASFIQKELFVKMVSERCSEESIEFTEVFDKYSWIRKTRKIIKSTAELIDNKLKLMRSEITLSGLNSLSTVETHKDIGLAIAREYSNSYLSQLFGSAMDEAGKDKKSSLQAIRRSLATFLIRKCSFKDNRSYTHEHRPNVVDYCCLDGFIRTIELITPKNLLPCVSEEELMPVALQVGKGMVDLLIADERMKDADWQSLNDSDIRALSTDWVSNLKIQKELARFLAPLNHQLEQKFHTLFKDQDFASFDSWVGDKLRFWQDWANSFSLLASWNRNIFHYLPWESLEDEEIKQIFADCAKDFDPKIEKWIGVFVIKELKPPPVPRTLAGVTFYDPSGWDYGEKRWFSDQITENSTCAKVSVKASTHLEAKRAAWLYLKDVLNCVAFSLSANRMRGGFNPVIHPNVYAHRLVDDSWSAGESLTRSDRPIRQSFENVEHFAPLFDSLLEAVRNSNVSMLQSKLLKAMHWYARGKWEQDSAQSFLFYWIGLEHLFDEERADVLLDLIAGLHINWRDVLGPGWYFLTRHEAEVIKQFTEDDEITAILNGSTELKDWNKDIRVLLNYENIIKLIDLLPDSKAKIKDYARGYVDYLKRFTDHRDAIQQDMESMRKVFRFRLLLLKHLRNDIVHHAITYTNNIDLYAGELEDVFEEAIVKLGNEAIRDIPEYSTIKEIIDKYQEIWI